MDPKLITSMYSRAVGTLVLAILVVASLLASSSMPSAMAAYSTNATYVYFYPEESGWTWEAYVCPNMDAEVQTPAYRQRYLWTEFCGDLGSYNGAHGCHKCLLVTNEAVGVPVTVRIVDICTINNDDDPVLKLDKDAFDEIDTDGQGAASGGPGDARLLVSYNIVDCQDPEDQ